MERWVSEMCCKGKSQPLLNMWNNTTFESLESRHHDVLLQQQQQQQHNASSIYVSYVLWHVWDFLKRRKKENLSVLPQVAQCGKIKCKEPPTPTPNSRLSLDSREIPYVGNNADMKPWSRSAYFFFHERDSLITRRAQDCIMQLI